MSYRGQQQTVESGSLPQADEHEVLVCAQHVVIVADVFDAVLRSLYVCHHTIVGPDARARVESTEQLVEHSISVEVPLVPKLRIGIEVCPSDRIDVGPVLTDR